MEILVLGYRTVSYIVQHQNGLSEILKKNRKMKKETLLGYVRTIQKLMNDYPDQYVFDLTAGKCACDL